MGSPHVQRTTSGRCCAAPGRRRSPGPRCPRRRSSWLDGASPRRGLAMPSRGSVVAAPTATTMSFRCSRAPFATSRSALRRGRPTLATRARFQAIALVLRDERARVRADDTLSPAQRAERLKRLDGIATLLAKTAVRDAALLALLDEDAEVSDEARSLKREMQQSGRASRRRSRRRRPPRRPRPPPRPASCRSRWSRGSWPTPSSPRTSRPPGRARPRTDQAGQLGADRPAAQLVRAGGARASPRAWRCPPRRAGACRAAGS